MTFGNESKSLRYAGDRRVGGGAMRSTMAPGGPIPFETDGIGSVYGNGHSCAIGVDIVSIKKIAAVLDRHPGAAESLFTATEIAYARSASNKYERFAARFAAKEAVLKALGMGMAKGMSWQEIEVATVPSGRPILRLSGAVSSRAGHLGLDKWLLSLAHCREYAVAYVSAHGETVLTEIASGPAKAAVPAGWANDQEAWL